jgi:hypothetical protein
MTVPCFTCDAAVDEPCKAAGGGWARYAHATRVQTLWEQVLTTAELDNHLVNHERKEHGRT